MDKEIKPKKKTKAKQEVIDIEEKKKRRQKKLDNLMSVEDINARRTPEERKKAASKAGKRSVEVRRQNKVMMDMARKILNLPVGESYANVKSVMARFGISEKDMNYASALLAVMAVKGISGDIMAAKFVRDSAGYDPQTILKEEQLEYMKENGQNINITMDGELTTKSRVQIYLPERDEDPE